MDMGYLDHCILMLHKAGAQKAELLNVKDITFETSVCKECEKLSCKNNKKWTCPPHIEGVNTLIGELSDFQHAIVFQAIFQQTSDDNVENAKLAQQSFRKMTNKIAQLLSGFNSSTKLLSEGGCMICEECGENKNKPCGFPSVAYSCFDAYGIQMDKLLETCGLKRQNGLQTKTQTGIIFLR